MSEPEWDEEDLFPVLRAGDIETEAVSENWLIEDLWSASAVGWVAGQPKICLCRARHKQIHAAPPLMPRYASFPAARQAAGVFLLTDAA